LLPGKKISISIVAPRLECPGRVSPAKDSAE
jgi:hypothetical protein